MAKWQQLWPWCTRCGSGSVSGRDVGLQRNQNAGLNPTVEVGVGEIVQEDSPRDEQRNPWYASLTCWSGLQKSVRCF